jgi:hypothetical protein
MAHPAGTLSLSLCFWSRRNSAKLPPLSRPQLPMIVVQHLNNSRSQRGQYDFLK